MTGNFLTRSQAFQRLTKWAFSVCDSDGTGQVGKTELYAGILLVHLQIAKYAGAAACYPPTRQVVDDLFEASDDDQSGGIDEKEFASILVICCAQILRYVYVHSRGIWLIQVCLLRATLLSLSFYSYMYFQQVAYQPIF
jgi:hypothetical protein